MTDERRREVEKRMTEMMLELKGYANELSSAISVNAYPDKERETRNGDIFFQYNPHRTTSRKWFVSHNKPNLRGVLTELENKIHRIDERIGRK